MKEQIETVLLSSLSRWMSTRRYDRVLLPIAPVSAVVVGHGDDDDDDVERCCCDVPQYCCCGSAADSGIGSNCERHDTPVAWIRQSAAGQGDRSNTAAASAASVSIVPCCLCAASFVAVCPEFLLQSLTLAVHTVMEHTTTPTAAEVASRLFWTRAVWPAALGGFDVVIDTSSALVDFGRDAAVPQLQRLLQSNSEAAAMRDIAKIDVWLGVLWSVALHTSKLPMLDHRCGPAALVLCATQRQCDEAMWLLQPVAKALKLVVHNTFEPFPLIPQDQRADIVISTPLHVHGVVWGAPSLPMGDLSRLSALHGCRRAMREPPIPLGGSAGTPTSKPYQLSFVGQLAVLDVDGMLRLGFLPLLEALSQPQPPAAAASSTKVAESGPVYQRLPAACQWYVVAASTLGVAVGLRLQNQFSTGSRVAMIADRFHNEGVGKIGPRKRSRTNEGTPACSGDASSELSVLFRGALTVSLLHRDPLAALDFANAVTEEWSNMDSVTNTSDKEEDKAPRVVVQVGVALFPVAPNHMQRGIASPSHAGCEPEVVLRVKLSDVDANNRGARVAKLRALARKFDGTMFEGNVVTAVVNSEDDKTPPLRVADGVATPTLSAWVTSTLQATNVKIHERLRQQSEAPPMSDFVLRLGEAFDGFANDEERHGRAAAWKRVHDKIAVHLDAKTANPSTSAAANPATRFCRRWIAARHPMDHRATTHGHGPDHSHADHGALARRTPWGCSFLSPRCDDSEIGASSTVIILRGIASDGDVFVSRRVQGSASISSPLEDVLTLAETCVFVKSFGVHADSQAAPGSHGSVSLVIECWNRASAAELFEVVSQQWVSAGVCSVHWMTPEVFIGGLLTEDENGDAVDEEGYFIPHPWDATAPP